MKPWSIWIGFDPDETAAFAVARESVRRHLNVPIPTQGVRLDELRRRGLYTRQTELRDGKLWDVVSDAPMSTQFAISRFLVPHLAGSGWALFMDADMLARGNLARLFEQADSTKAVMVVKHDHRPKTATKMDGQEQTSYARKNWSSLCLFNCDHEANKTLTPSAVNTIKGRDLHRFCWLVDDEIGELGPEWNFLVGHTDPQVDPQIVHFTDGGPWLDGYRDVPFADEWWQELNRWAA